MRLSLCFPTQFKRLLSTLAVIALLANIGYGAEKVHHLNPAGSTELSLSKPKVRVTLWVTKLTNTFPYKNALFWGGDVGVLPKNFLSEIQVRSHSQTIFVPFSAYSDLGAVHRAFLRRTADGFALYLYGGETGTAYSAELIFAGGFMQSRTVFLNEFPQETREVTKYSFPENSDE